MHLKFFKLRTLPSGLKEGETLQNTTTTLNNVKRFHNFTVFYLKTEQTENILLFIPINIGSFYGCLEGS